MSSINLLVYTCGISLSKYEVLRKIEKKHFMYESNCKSLNIFKCYF